MDFYKEIENGFYNLGMYLFDIYVNIYFWIQKQEYIDLSYFYCLLKTEKEPELNEWIHIYSLYHNSAIYETSSLYYNSKKYEISTTNIETTDIIKEYQSFYHIKKNPHLFENKSSSLEITEHLFIAKKNDGYFLRTLFPGYDEYKEEVSLFNKSNITFPFIEYSHPKMNTTIELVIPDGMWMVGNELFTPTFILRLLQQKSNFYIFDMDYIITILDHDIRNIVFNSKSYILLEKDAYVFKDGFRKI